MHDARETDTTPYEPPTIESREHLEGALTSILGSGTPV
jgi:hypothetical protein